MEPAGPPDNSSERSSERTDVERVPADRNVVLRDDADETGWSTTVVCQALRMLVSDRRCSHSLRPCRVRRVNRRLAAAAILWSGAEGHGRLTRSGLPLRAEMSIARPQG
jgi:hypothetical protein